MTTTPHPVPTSESDNDAEERAFRLANEFAEVRVRKVMTRNGARLEIYSSRLGLAVRLCPLELESLTWQNSQLYSELLATPAGSES